MNGVGLIIWKMSGQKTNHTILLLPSKTMFLVMITAEYFSRVMPALLRVTVYPGTLFEAGSFTSVLTPHF